MNKRALLVANSASMIDHFNRDNIAILKSLNYEITVAADFQHGNSSTKERINEFKTELLEQGIEVLPLSIPRSITHIPEMFKSISRLKKHIAEHPYEIIHTQTPFGGVVGRLAAKKARKKNKTKVIYFVHGFHFFKGASAKNHIIYYNIEKYLSRYTDCLITLNHEDYAAACNKFKHPNVKYVPGIGVDTDVIYNMQVDKTAKCESLGIPTDKKIILTVAELIPRKNLEGTIRAFAGITNQDSVLVICGKGQLAEQLKKLAVDLHITDRVFFAGYRTDILDIYHIADIFLFTSFQEGLPVGVMQAMAAGLPIIASDIRGNRDLLGAGEGILSSDYLVDVNDINAFTNKLDYLLANPDIRNSLGSENTKRCRELFDISIVHKKMLAIYKELAPVEKA
ncbi:MAG: glycosyltransferase [Clostridium sp.]|nr:glycosyltransferase [Clostridium sp.]MCM1209295.1 glycosyltransferase [Ruminococcus sp.]